MTDTATNEYPARGYGATSPDSGLAELTLTRRDLRDDDVLIEISHCGICHSDLHFSRNDWGNAKYPAVPGHEITGLVAAVGDKVTAHKLGDRVAVGCMVDSCLTCDHCEQDMEQSCLNGMTGTYGGTDRRDGTSTMGGYSERIVVREEFVLRVPEGLDMAAAAPLLCAGITTYSPLRDWKVGRDSVVAVVGLGGLGHMGVKFAAAMGAHVTVITTSESKRDDALALGASDVILSTDRDAMKAARNRFNMILDTVPVRHELKHYVPLLKMHGALVLVGMIDLMPEMHSGLLLGRKIITGSGIGGIKETQEMLDFCAEKNITPDIEMIQLDGVNDAFERMEAGDVKYRFVIDVDQFAGRASE